MHVAETGQGRPLIFLHGWSSHGGYFAPQFSTLGDRFHLLVPDLPGHRRSIAAVADLTIPRLADALHGLIAARSLSNVILVGWSMGALVAFDYIARYGSAALSALVIEDMTAKIINDAEWRLGIRNGFDAMQSAAAIQSMQTDWPAYAQGTLPRLFARSHIPDHKLYQWVATEIAKNDGRIMATLWASMAEQDYRRLLPQLRLPVLLLHGGDSQLYEPAVSQWMAAAIPGARRLCLDRAGHTPHLEMPAEFNAALTNFVAAVS